MAYSRIELLSSRYLFFSFLSTEFTFPLSGDEGRFSSPNYPNQYPLNATCTWTIESSTDKRIEIHFVDFRLEKNKRCLYDYLEIREIELHTGKPSTKNAIRYCGYNKPPNYISKGNKVQITFRSDPMSQVDKGFMASWRLLDKDHVDSMSMLSHVFYSVYEVPSNTCSTQLFYCKWKSQGAYAAKI